MYEIIVSRSFKKGLKRYQYRKKSLIKIQEALALLQQNGELKIYGEHVLQGDFSGFRECHIEPDLLLVYRVLEENQCIILQDIGTHSYIFG
jgi:mRNA interferase YafQ